MKEELKSSIIKEALLDFKQIEEAADANAKKRLANEFPDSFNKILKEELNKNKAKESYKKIDNADEPEMDDAKSKNESDMKNQVKETVTVTDTVGSGKPFNEKPKKVEKVVEDVKITDTIGDSAPFTEKKKNAVKIEEDRDTNFMGAIEGNTPNQSKGDGGVAFKDKIKTPQSGKPMSNLKEEFDMSGLEEGSVESALDNANDDDEIITIDEIEAEIAQMEGMSEEISDMAGLPQMGAAASAEGQGGDAYTKLVSMRNELDEMIKGMDNVYETMSPQQYANTGAGGETAIYEENDTEITDEDINSVIGDSSEVPVDEAKGVSYSSGTITPGKLGDGYGTHGRFRTQSQNESIKLGGLIEENKKLTKKLNETKKQKDVATTLVENYKTALDKYRNQLKEMAIFNSNLAHVNNLLVNESLALTQNDKIKIINEFKTVGSITESQNKYTSLLSEMKGSRKTISESVVDKVTTSVHQSSKQILDEVVEKTAYANDSHINRMKKVIDLIEKRGKK
jgi:hypothetical protein